ncbi:hypothetical protein CANCADRAFT_21901 [Tortispora caseinolytica NRRL Y-17796]|uniref:Autophagy-related protein 18 n=1 Tax=Tortispora caseinolytica NRRL Y-17796 TaxID=767744 RepID=A0A1E4TIF3_9ASCO|nr:hypothetical protein CANCADRAFT_21901 [Tortispora caseinolytica NRRL Y-17796]
MEALNFVNFNQDFSCISVGTRQGYRIYSCEPFGQCYSQNEGGMAIVEMLFCTSLVAMVGMGDDAILSPRRLHITNTKRNTVICELTFPTSILAVKLNRRRLVVVLEEQMYMYDISNMKLLHTFETSPNPTAICSLSSSSDNCYLAYPASVPAAGSPFAKDASAPAASSANDRTAGANGDVILFDCGNLQPLNVVEAHKSPLALVALNPEGTLLATASEKGTIIRIFSVPGAQKLYQFRRGTYPTHIYCMNFNLSSTFLAVSSSSDTIHIFKLSGPDDRVKALGGSQQSLSDIRKRNGTVASMIRRSSQTIGRSVAGAFGGYLPSAVTEMWEPQRDFAYVKLPSARIKSVVAMSSTLPEIMVVNQEGYFLQYSLDLDNGGECSLIKQYSLLDNEGP